MTDDLFIATVASYSSSLGSTLILPGELVNDWIRPDTKPENLLGNALTDMVFEKVVEG